MIRLPLLKDNHNHFFTYSALDNAIDLFYFKSKNHALKLIHEKQNQKYIIVKGWFDSYYSFTSNDLNHLPPIIIANNSLHKYVFNSKAEDIIKKDFPEWVQNNDNQDWVENNIYKIISFIAGLFPINEDIVQKSYQKLLKSGVCFASDMFVTNPKIIELLKNEKISNITEVWTSIDNYNAINDKQKALCKGIKLFTDGANGAFSAAIESYKIKSSPFLSYNDSELNEILDKALSFKTMIAIHAIGDIAIEKLVNTIKKHQSKILDGQIRIEHAQFITKKQAKLAKDLGLILCMQPNFNMDSIVYTDRLNKHYLETNNPFRMLIDEVGFVPGKDLIFGSDGMPTGIEGVIEQSLFPPVSGQKLKIDEFAVGYCSDNNDLGYIEIEIDELKKKIFSRVETPLL